MAEVWRAVDQRLQRPVAIKFLTNRYAEDPEFLVRFFSEAQAVATISHGHVVRVLDFGSADGGPFLVMELVEGGSLCGRIGRPLAVEEAFGLVAQAAEGAGAAHAAGIVHRDLKPGNILMTRTGTVKLADFGIATLGSNDHLTATGTALGSPHYISPEGAAGAGASPASDVYSLGIVLYELLTGHRPFEADSPTALAIAHVDAEPDPPSSYRPELPSWVDALVLKCLSKNPEDRFADGTELAAALRAGETGAPVLPTPSRTSGVFSSRWKLAAASLSGVVLLALGGFLFAAPGPNEAPVAEAEAEASSGRGRTRPSPKPTTTAVVYENESSEISPAETSSPTPTPSETAGEEGDDDSTSSQESPAQTGTREEDQEEPEEEPTAEPSPPEDSETEEPPPEDSETEEPPDEDGSQDSSGADPSPTES